MTYGQKPTPELHALEAQAEEVKSPYKQKHGEDVDEEQLVDEDGMRWVKMFGTGVPMQSCALEDEVERKSALAGGRFQTLSRSHHRELERAYGRKPAPELSALEAQRRSKAHYRQKHGEDVNEEELVDEDGMLPYYAVMVASLRHLRRLHKLKGGFFWAWAAAATSPTRTGAAAAHAATSSARTGAAAAAASGFSWRSEHLRRSLALEPLPP